MCLDSWLTVGAGLCNLLVLCWQLWRCQLWIRQERRHMDRWLAIEQQQRERWGMEL